MGRGLKHSTRAGIEIYAPLRLRRIDIRPQAHHECDMGLDGPQRLSHRSGWGEGSNIQLERASRLMRRYGCGGSMSAHRRIMNAIWVSTAHSASAAALSGIAR